MVRTRFALILYFRKSFFEINEDMVQILLMLEVLFTLDSKDEDLFCDAPSSSEPSLFFSNYLFSLEFKPMDFGCGQHEQPGEGWAPSS